jgi:hypothetical protein
MPHVYMECSLEPVLFSESIIATFILAGKQVQILFQILKQYLHIAVIRIDWVCKYSEKHC